MTTDAADRPVDRFLGDLRRLASVATLGLVLGGSGAVEASPAPQDALRIRPVGTASRGADDSSSRMVVRRARTPIFVEIDLGGEAGVPGVSRDAVARIMETIDANPRRLITLRLGNAPLHFFDLDPATRKSLIEKRGEQVVGAFDEFMAGEVLDLVRTVRSARPRSPLAVHGIPFEGGHAESRSANRAYDSVLREMNAIVVGGGVVVSESTDEASLLRRAYPKAMAAADGRPILFASNDRWRIVTHGSKVRKDGKGDKESEGVEADRPDAVTTDKDDEGGVLASPVSGEELPSVVGLPGTEKPNSGSLAADVAAPPIRGGGGAGGVSFGGGGGGGGGSATGGADSDDLGNGGDPESGGDGDDDGSDAGVDWDSSDEVIDDDESGDGGGDADVGPGEEDGPEDADGDAGDQQANEGDSQGDESGSEGDSDDGGHDSSDDHDADDDDIFTPGVIPFGTSFGGRTSTPQSVGSPTDPYYARQPVARWDVVPFQVVSSGFEVGVVAFHPNGISKVEISANGGAWLAITESAVNPRTGVREYWGVLDEGPGTDVIELRAKITPAVAGQCLVLQNPIESVGDLAGVTRDNFGIHSMFLMAAAPASEEVWVSQTGSDDWNGTQATPFRTLDRAASVLKSLHALDGGTIKIGAPGEYAAPSSISSGQMQSWLTITLAEGLVPEDVTIVSPAWASSELRGSIRPMVQKIRWRGVTLDWATINHYYPESQDYVWFDESRWIDRGGRANVWNDNGWLYQMYQVRPQIAGHYATGCEVVDQLYGFVGLEFARDCHASVISGDSFTNTRCILNCTVQDQKGGQIEGLDFHCDVLQYWGEHRNLLVFGLMAGDLADVQPIFLDKQSTFDECAFVNIAFADLANVTIQLNSICTGVMFQNVTMAENLVVFRTDLPSGDRFVGEDVLFRNCVIRWVGGGTYGDVTPVPGTAFDHCHFTEIADLDPGAASVVNASFGEVSVTQDPDRSIRVVGPAADLVFGTGARLVGIGSHLGDAPDRSAWGSN